MVGRGGGEEEEVGERFDRRFENAVTESEWGGRERLVGRRA